MRVAAACAALCVLLPLGRAAAGETCPDLPDEEAALRRSMAKEWFARAEEAEAVGDGQTAVKRYACSLKLAPHPSTAYNLGTAAEKAGDLSMAVDAFNMYLNLARDAADRAVVEARVSRLEAKITELRLQLEAKPPTAAPDLPPAGKPAPPPVADAMPAGASAGPTPARDRLHGYRVSGWITLGAALGALGTGVAFNLVARSKMHDCFAQWDSDRAAAQSLCDGAKPFAYGSYGLFALSGALGITGATLLLWRVEDGASLSLRASPDGGTLAAWGRF